MVPRLVFGNSQLLRTFHCIPFRLLWECLNRYFCKSTLWTLNLLRPVVYTDGTGPSFLISYVNLIMHISWDFLDLRLAFEVWSCSLRVTLGSPHWLHRMSSGEYRFLLSQLFCHTSTHFFLLVLNADTIESLNLVFRKVEHLTWIFDRSWVWSLQLWISLGLLDPSSEEVEEVGLEEALQTWGVALWFFLGILGFLAVSRFAIVFWKEVAHRLDLTWKTFGSWNLLGPFLEVHLRKHGLICLDRVGLVPWLCTNVRLTVLIDKHILPTVHSKITLLTWLDLLCRRWPFYQVLCLVTFQNLNVEIDFCKVLLEEIYGLRWAIFPVGRSIAATNLGNSSLEALD